MRTFIPLLLVLGALGRAGAAGPPGQAVAVLPSGAEFSLEVAADDASRARGYMFRAQVGPKEGMIFVFEREDRHPFWMKNCKVPLDIIWLDASFRVVHMASDVPPCPPEGECPSIIPLRSGRYVLEFAGGTALRERLRLSDPVVILSAPPLP
jgi:hypothetical protein